MQNSARVVQLQYLVAFEASARLQSFKLAAEELHVTPSAVGQQIKSLEKQLGLELFVRKTRGILLSTAGESYYHVAINTLTSFDKGLEKFSQKFYSSTLNITMTPLVAYDIVIPRLHEFQAAHPHINLVIEASMEIQDLNGTNLDCSIRCGIPPWENYIAKPLSEMKLNFVASKKYLERNPFSNFSGFQDHSLIHYHENNDGWGKIKKTGGFSSEKEHFFSDYVSSIRAAEQGLGIAIGLFPASNKAVEEGRLALVFPTHMTTGWSYCFLTKTNDQKQQSYDILYAWLKDIFPKL